MQICLDYEEQMPSDFTLYMRNKRHVKYGGYNGHVISHDHLFHIFFVHIAIYVITQIV